MSCNSTVQRVGEDWREKEETWNQACPHGPELIIFDYILILIIIASIAGLMGRKRGHWPEFQIRPHMSSREVLMVYIYSK